MEFPETVEKGFGDNIILNIIEKQPQNFMQVIKPIYKTFKSLNTTGKLLTNSVQTKRSNSNQTGEVTKYLQNIHDLGRLEKNTDMIKWHPYLTVVLHNTNTLFHLDY